MSVRKKLNVYATVPVFHGEIPPGGSKQLNKELSKHAKARIIKKYVDWDQYFKFAFVRNPWSWLVSGYHYVKKDKKDWRHNIANRMNFKEFTKWSLVDSTDKRHVVLRLGQTDFVVENGKIIVDFVGKLEKMQKDFSIICNRIGINTVIPHVNQTKHDDYRNYYDSYTVELVGKCLNEDIKRFGYRFDG